MCALLISLLAINACVCLMCYRVICKLLASKSESIRVQALKVLGYFLKHLGHKSVPFLSLVLCLQQKIRNWSPAEALLGTKYSVERDVEQPLLGLGPFVCVCLQKIMSSSSGPGGIIALTACTGREVEPWWAAVNAGGLIPPMWHSKPIAAWQGMSLWSCTWAQHL